MSGLSQFTGAAGPVTSLVNAATGSKYLVNMVPAANAVAALSGVLVAATLKTALSVTGRGRLNWASVHTNDATSRTVRIRVTVDGTVIVNATTSAIATSGYGALAVGGADNTYGYAGPVYQPIDFRSSLLIEIASSLSETDKLTAAWNYEVWA